MSNDTSQPQVERYSKCRNNQAMVKLIEIVVDAEAFCHRSDEKLTPDKLEDLARSLAQEGQQTPLVVVEAYWDVDADDRGELSATPTEWKLIAGHRRYYAYKQGITDGLPGFAEDMDVSVTVMQSPDRSKNAEGAFQPLPDHAVPKLRIWLADKRDGRVLPLEKKRTSEMLAEDLTAAKIPVVDERGLVVDFHALRYTYCALLALNGVQIAVVSQLLRHSSLDLTAKLYLQLGLRDLLAAVNKLPEF